jgi:hypothetical protein
MKGLLLSFLLSQIGLQGEHLGLYKADGLENVNWLSTAEPPKTQPLTWYKVNTWTSHSQLPLWKYAAVVYLDTSV